MRSRSWLAALFLLAVGVVLALILSPVSHTVSSPPLEVGWLGQTGDVMRHVELDPQVHIRREVGSLMVLAGDPGADKRMQTVARVRAGGTLVVLSSPSTPLAFWRLIGVEAGFAARPQPVTCLASPVRDPIVSQINWGSAPLIEKSTLVTGEAWRRAGGVALVTARENGAVLVGRIAVGRGRVFLVAPFVVSQKDGNQQFTLWAYYNYFLYSLLRQAAGQPCERYEDWAYSPVPHQPLRRLMLILAAALWAVTIAAFAIIRKRGRGRERELVHFFPSGFRQGDGAGLWEAISFTRPLAGFLFALTIGFLYYAPSIVLWNNVFPRFILPYPQAIGAWQWIKQVMGLVWLVFDMGTDLALIKYYAQYRVKEPARAVQYIQLFVWWQCLSGLIQFTGIPLFAANVLVHSNYAYLATYFALSALTQFPGFLGMYIFVFRAIQRFDLEQLLTMVGMIVLIPAQFLFVYLFRRWGAAHLAYGPAVGGVIGYGVGAYLNVLVQFVLGFFILRRLGFRQKWLFMANFKWSEARQALGFGVKAAAGNIAVALGYSLQMLVISERMLNYTELTGMFQMAMDYTTAIGVVYLLFFELMPAVSEAFSHGKAQLTRYYISQAWKYGAMFSFAIGGGLLAVVDKYVLGTLGAQWSRAALLATPVLIWGVLQFPAWLGDQIQLGANRPGLQSALMIAEQAIRIVLVFLLVPPFGIWGVIYAYIPALVLKGLAALYVNHKVIVTLYLNVWQGIVAPLLALIVNYGALRWLVLVLWRPEAGVSNMLFFGCLIGGQLTYFFFTGLFGGWDDESIAELNEVGAYTRFSRPLAWLYLAFIRAGAALSPLHNRFKTTIYVGAMAEAAALTAEKVQLENLEVDTCVEMVDHPSHALGS